MPIFKIHHITKYEYDRPVRNSMNEIRIFPYVGAEQEVLMHDLIITHQPEVHTYFDYWGNKAGVFNLPDLHKQLILESKLVVRTLNSPNQYLNFNGGTDTIKKDHGNNLQLLELSSASQIKSQKQIDTIVSQISQPWKSIAAIVQDCCQYIFQHFQYIKGITNIETTVDEILEHRAGVCQDFAHVMLHILRTLKIPSRYVSGYICPNKNGMRGEGATHAWIEAWIPNQGWVGIDPTNNIWVTNTHVKLAVGRNFSDCTPVKGTFSGPARQTLSVFVSVSYEDGNSFEDSSRVKMHAQASSIIEDDIAEVFAAQQQ